MALERSSLCTFWTCREPAAIRFARKPGRDCFCFPADMDDQHTDRFVFACIIKLVLLYNPGNLNDVQDQLNRKWRSRYTRRPDVCMRHLCLQVSIRTFKDESLDRNTDESSRHTTLTNTKRIDEVDHAWHTRAPPCGNKQ